MMDLANKYRLRVQNCIGTLIDVHKSVAGDDASHSFLVQFEKLKKTLDRLDMSLVCEGDILMVEEATNALLREFKGIFSAQAPSRVYEKPIN
jgi:hypothetical protein